MGLNSHPKGTMDARERLLDNGYENVAYFINESYDTALIGVSDDNRAIYDYDLMIEYLMDKYDWSEQESIDWIEVNTLKALPYMGKNAPIIMYRLLD